MNHGRNINVHLTIHVRSLFHGAGRNCRAFLHQVTKSPTTRSRFINCPVKIALESFLCWGTNLQDILVVSDSPILRQFLDNLWPGESTSQGSYSRHRRGGESLPINWTLTGKNSVANKVANIDCLRKSPLYFRQSAQESVKFVFSWSISI